ncbi:hypothetical protein L1887_20893 [Cichorium endivia]|nr:hypothetical protein L1887_20893 [Cichorium endivia]
MPEESAMKKLNTNKQIEKFSLLSRNEHFSGNTHYATEPRGIVDSGNGGDWDVIKEELKSTGGIHRWCCRIGNTSVGIGVGIAIGEG